MTTGRLEELLQTALEEGAVPADATTEERAELEPLLARARELQRNAARVDAEASGSMVTARARFERRIQERRPAAGSQKPAPLRQSSPLGRWFSGGALTFAGSAAALLVIALVALLVFRPFGGVETAAALTIDDYVQIEGVVSANNGDAVTVQSSELGDLEVAISDTTALSDGAGTREPASLQPGDPVLVSGIVTAKRAIAASNVAVASRQEAPTPAAARKTVLLKEYREGLVGRVALVTLSPDGTRARVLFVVKAENLLVEVDAASMDQFLATGPRAVGTLVRVVAAPDLRKGVFRLEAVDGAPASATPSQATNAAKPQFTGIRGVVIGRTLNVLMVRTDRGIVPVVLRPLTSIRFGKSGLTAEDVRTGETIIGHEVAISGNPDETTGRRIIASIVVVLGKPPAR